MVDVSEKMIEAAWNAHRKGIGLEARPFPNTREDCRQLYTRIYTAMHSAREVDGETVERVAEWFCDAFDDNNFWQGAPEIIRETYIAKARAFLAAMGEGDVR